MSNDFQIDDADRAIGAQLRGIDHEGGAVDTRQIEMGKGARITGFGLHGYLSDFGGIWKRTTRPAGTSAT